MAPPTVSNLSDEHENQIRPVSPPIISTISNAVIGIFQSANDAYTYLCNRIGDLETKANETAELIDENKEHINDRVEMNYIHCQDLIEGLKDRVEALEFQAQEYDYLEQRITFVERNEEHRSRVERRNNIVIKGMNGVNEANKMDLVRRMFLNHNFCIPLEAVQIVWRKNNVYMLIVTLCSYYDKMVVVYNKGMFRRSGIWIDRDRTWQERRFQKHLRRIAEEFKQQANHVYVDEDTIFVDDARYTWVNRLGLKLNDGRQR